VGILTHDLGEMGTLILVAGVVIVAVVIGPKIWAAEREKRNRQRKSRFKD
jgi:hypothetical protein